jgi:CRISPR-associated exonuclease Cas4
MALIIGAVLGVAALVLWWLASRLQRRTGLPTARVRYDDASSGRPVEKALVSHRYRLTGRPDYLLEVGGRLVPVEVKPTRQAREPYPPDLMQLAAYCLLVEETSGQRPPYGILRYAEQSWEIPFDSRLRERLLALLAEMEEAERAADVPRSHEVPAKCQWCSQRAHCDQRLTA